jgi:hypothetical protein
MVCKKNTGDLYWFGLKNTLCPVRDESSVLSCTKVLIVGVTSESERRRGSQVSRREWSARVRATLPDPSQGPEESFARVFSCACEGFTTWFFRRCPLEWSLHALLYSIKEVQGYKMSVRGPCWGSSPGASGALIRWHRGLHCRGMTSVLPGPAATW